MTIFLLPSCCSTLTHPDMLIHISMYSIQCHHIYCWYSVDVLHIWIYNHMYIHIYYTLVYVYIKYIYIYIGIMCIYIYIYIYI
jgi:hypothetical protein